ADRERERSGPERQRERGANVPGGKRRPSDRGVTGQQQRPQDRDGGPTWDWNRIEGTHEAPFPRGGERYEARGGRGASTSDRRRGRSVANRNRVDLGVELAAGGAGRLEVEPRLPGGVSRHLRRKQRRERALPFLQTRHPFRLERSTGGRRVEPERHRRVPFPFGERDRHGGRIRDRVGNRRLEPKRLLRSRAELGGHEVLSARLHIEN